MVNDASWGGKTGHLLAFFLFFLLVVLPEQFYRDPLYAKSLTVIESIQGHRNQAATTYFELVSWLGKGPIYFAAIFIAIVFFSVPRAFYYIFVYTLGIALYDVGKNYYAQGRPYFETDKITPYGECTAGFGNPSGHSVMSTQWAILIWLDLFWDRNFKSLGSFLFFLLGLAFFGSIMFARVYVGVHAINQVIFGSSIGLALALYSHFLIRKPLMGHIEKILSSRSSPNKMYLVQAVLISFIAIALNTFVFIKDLNLFVIPQVWKDNLQRACKTTFEGELWYKTYSESMRAQITVAAYFGIFFLLRGKKAEAEKEFVPINSDWRQGFKQVFSVATLVKIIVLLIGAVIPGLLMFFVPSNPYAVSNIFGAFVPSLLLGFILFGVCPSILFRLGYNKDQLSKTYKVVSDRVTSERLIMYKSEEEEE